MASAKIHGLLDREWVHLVGVRSFDRPDAIELYVWPGKLDDPARRVLSVWECPDGTIYVVCRNGADEITQVWKVL